MKHRLSCRLRGGNAVRRARSVAENYQAMKSGLRDQAEGAVKEVKGRAKQKWAKAVGAPDKQIEGTVDRLAGKLQRKTGQIKRDKMRE
jgi:uncharacterized protein YjbJ (UPF0337 family)